MMVLVLLANVLLSVGTPGIPGGAIASFAALATMAGLPAGVMGVYIRSITFSLPLAREPSQKRENLPHIC